VVTLLPPDLSTAFIVAIVVPLILGFIVGLIMKSLLKIGIAIAALIIILILVGVLTPGQVLTPLISLIKSGASSSALASEAARFAGYLPYSSITFIIGLVIGFLKG